MVIYRYYSFDTLIKVSSSSSSKISLLKHFIFLASSTGRFPIYFFVAWWWETIYTIILLLTVQLPHFMAFIFLQRNIHRVSEWNDKCFTNRKKLFTGRKNSILWVWQSKWILTFFTSKHLSLTDRPNCFVIERTIAAPMFLAIFGTKMYV